MQSNTQTFRFSTEYGRNARTSGECRRMVKTLVEQSELSSKKTNWILSLGPCLPASANSPQAKQAQRSSHVRKPEEVLRHQE
jgi:hypothetical protein